MKISTNISFLLLLLVAYSATGSDMEYVSASFFSKLNRTDSIHARISQNIVFNDESPGSIDSLFRSTLQSFPELYAIIKINSEGTIVNDINRDSVVNVTRNVSDKSWFNIPLSKAISFSAGMFTANSRLCFLKTYPLFENNLNFKTNGVLAVLIDADFCLKKLSEDYPFPFTLFSNNSIVYQSDPKIPLSRIPIPQHEKLELVYFDLPFDSLNRFFGKTQQIKSIKSPIKMPTAYLPWFLTVITTLIAFFLARFIKPRIKREELIALEYSNLPEKTQKLIHDRAVSQLYCEIKRQLELHETVKIEQEVREKLHNEILQKTIGSNKATLTQ